MPRCGRDTLFPPPHFVDKENIHTMLRTRVSSFLARTLMTMRRRPLLPFTSTSQSVIWSPPVCDRYVGGEPARRP